MRGLLSEKGHQFAEVTHQVTPMPGGPKLVHLSFVINEGPKVRIREIDFVGNKAVSDGALRKQMKANKQEWMFSFITGRGTFQEPKFEEDAEHVNEYYRNKGYIAARLGAPELKYLEDSSDGKTRYVQLRINVQEGGRYKVGNFGFEGNKVVKSEGLRTLFKLKEGEFYSEKHIRKGLESSREVYGQAGYWEFTGFPDLKPRDIVEPNAPPEEKPAGPIKTPDGSPIVDVTMRMQEGEQYFVNRVSFLGNTTTRDNVVRREIRLLEGGVFNTEALKHSVKRINQLGYFKNLEGNDAIKVEKTPGEKNKVDVTLDRRRTEPEPGDVRCGRLAVRGLLRPAGVPDIELPRPRRERHVLGARRPPREELPGGVHRAVPVRSADHRGHRRLQAGAADTSTRTRRSPQAAMRS